MAPQKGRRHADHEPWHSSGSTNRAVAETRHRIVVIGGGADGLELATRLANKLGRHGKAHITLIDKARRRVWKPLLHEIAKSLHKMHQLALHGSTKVLLETVARLITRRTEPHVKLH